MDALAAAKTAFPGFELVRLARVGSTQDFVRQAARRGAAAGYCCVAEEQTAGRGRQDRAWLAPPGSALLFSLLLRLPSRCSGLVPLAAGCSVAAVLRDHGVAAKLKWPNDVLIDNEKIAGILLEGESDSVDGGIAQSVLGVGLNLTIDEFPAGLLATSLHRHISPVPTWEQMLGAIVTGLAPRLQDLVDDNFSNVIEEWRTLALGMGTKVAVAMPGATISGVAETISADGALLVRTGSGLVRCLAGEVHLVSPPGSA